MRSITASVTLSLSLFTFTLRAAPRAPGRGSAENVGVKGE